MGIFLSLMVIFLTIVALEEVPMRIDTVPVLMILVGFAVFIVNIIFRVFLW